ncbi:ATP-binding cassette domain-containing protein [Turicimonas muris]|uniref:ABC transporter ATP-binding protein n=6 Tax=Turicimonas muris TaxID=1796652 RepID=A0A227KAJ5_9BURK|nr:ATP-binding cassette domain-containing protein [Turicimonas muris]ANU65784.1 ABC transporter ATP-binding protein [Burkholderiales bacterium YL45]OXE44507.1 ABC transporter ATP-binding protein [Turicimonas muris]QQQ96942.1 ABC transporter ATP-binding protein [Turicimonas muris]
MEELVLQAQKLCKDFPPEVKRGEPAHALIDLDLTVRKGERVALIGPDGAGKTTFFRLVEKLLNPTSGQILLFDKDLKDQSDEIKDKIAYMPQKFGLYEDLTIIENLNLFADLKGIPKNERKAVYDELLQMTALAPFINRPAGKLSGGMKQKLGIACSLVSKPELLILDEPTAGVDPLSRKELWDVLSKVAKVRNTSVLISTGYMDEAARCDRIYILNEGKVLSTGTLSELTSPYQNQVFYLPCAEKDTRKLLEKVADSPDVIDAIPRGNGVKAVFKKELSKQDIKEKFNILDIRPLAPVLEDAFIATLKKANEHTAGHESFGTIDLKDLTIVKPDPSEILICVEDLVKKFGNFTAVDQTSFQVSRGEIFGLLGPNGAGKTTTFKMLCGLIPATSGKISVAGYNLRTARAEARKNIGYVAQFFSLYPTFTIKENLTFFGGAYGLDGSFLDSRVNEIAEQFELSSMMNVDSNKLNEGFKKRLSMAAALIHDPEILFLDEPTSSIDPLARRAFWKTINKLADIGKTIIITTHFMEEAEYCTKMAIQAAGRMLALGSPAEIKKIAGLNNTDSMDEAFLRIVENDRKGSKS